jgi:hypothetical protein
MDRKRDESGEVPATYQIIRPCRDAAVANLGRRRDGRGGVRKATEPLETRRPHKQLVANEGRQMGMRIHWCSPASYGRLRQRSVLCRRLRRHAMVPLEENQPPNSPHWKFELYSNLQILYKHCSRLYAQNTVRAKVRSWRTSGVRYCGSP